MKKTLYMECYTGISGDMTVAALLDLGVDEDKLVNTLKTLPVSGYDIEISRVKKSGIDAKDFDVILDKEHENHDHDMEFLHGHSHEEHHEHTHNNEEHHEHVHSHEEEHHEHTHNNEEHHEHHHSHEHRGLNDVIEIINKSAMTDKAKEIAVNIFMILGKGEAKAHGTSISEVHFHEVGAVDSIVDIAAVAICIDELQIENVIVPYICEGRGSIRCQHGVLPIPVPAVMNIIEQNNIDFHLTEVEGELVTPTGAAIVAALRTSNKLPEKFIISKTGIGAGKRNYEKPSLLRVMLIEKKSEDSDTVYKLESNIDDCTGENLGFLMEELFEKGARDVHFIPTYMKKNRPSYLLNVICKKDKVSELENTIFENTTTIGIRKSEMERSILERKKEVIKTGLGEVEIKVCTLPNGNLRKYPEYESVRKIAKNNKLSYIDTLNIIKEELGK